MESRALRFLEHLPLAHGRGWPGYAVGLLLSVGALWVRWAIGPGFPPGFPFLTFFPAVIFTAFFFGRGPGIFAAVLCELLAWYFFVPPERSFALEPGAPLALAFFTGVVTVDILLIDWMQRGNARLRRERERCERLAARSELLFSELQHRMSNNLQMVGAVLSLQKRSIDDPAARQALNDAGVKLQTIGRIQRQLYDASGDPQALDRMVPELTRDLIETAGKPGVTWSVEVDPEAHVPPDAAIPVALIVAEAISNSVEHAFAGRDTGHIEVRIEAVHGALALTVADNGAGPPEGFSVANATSLGVRIARTLAEQLGGNFTLAPRSGGGAVATLKLPQQGSVDR